MSETNFRKLTGIFFIIGVIALLFFARSEEVVISATAPRSRNSSALAKNSGASQRSSTRPGIKRASGWRAMSTSGVTTAPCKPS